MRTFREFVGDRDFGTVREMLFNILDPEDVIDKHDTSFLNRKLTEFNRRDKILTDPALSDIINKRDNRGAIIQAIQNDSTTVGNLLSLLTKQEEPEYMG